MDLQSIIVAVASPPGRAVRGLVRASGPDVLGLVDGLRAPGGSPLGTGRGIRPVRLDLGRGSLAVLALVMPGPGSATGEDVVELLAPGNPALLERIVDRLIEAGRVTDRDVRRAEPGEFTARAFMRGRMSLVQAEGVAAAVAARSDAELRAARQLLGDRLGREASDLAESVATLLALVEAGIDFTDEEDVVAIEAGELTGRLAGLIARLRAIVDRSVPAEQLEAAPWVVLAGPPNAGKSTLFNALLGRPRAIVSAVAGTTRDVLVEPLVVPGPAGPAEVLLVDAAGLDEAATGDELDERMRSGTLGAAARADLVRRCRPADEAGAEAGPAPTGDRSLSDRTLIVRTKADRLGSGRPADAGDEAVVVSALRGDGLETLRSAIGRRLAESAVSLAGDLAVLRPRHERSLRAAAEALVAAADLAGRSGGRSLDEPELVAAELRAGLDELGRIVGRIDPDEVLGRIFSSFCIGK